eukprot:TRINITY_DN1769_c0_g1_i2.p1 TRINITY_DN1769_c0_g1~~TRINITY_DN1769_c0_g1_i2.p1  ORF type:complete len:142 (+),score=10.17 TRINITY_DN1769_c0_g1_i2:174-599(+)
MDTVKTWNNGPSTDIRYVNTIQIHSMSVSTTAPTKEGIELQVAVFFTFHITAPREMMYSIGSAFPDSLRPYTQDFLKALIEKHGIREFCEGTKCLEDARTAFEEECHYKRLGIGLDSFKFNQLVAAGEHADKLNPLLKKFW